MPRSRSTSRIAPACSFTDPMASCSRAFPDRSIVQASQSGGSPGKFRALPPFFGADLVECVFRVGFLGAESSAASNFNLRFASEKAPIGRLSHKGPGNLDVFRPRKMGDI